MFTYFDIFWHSLTYVDIFWHILYHIYSLSGVSSRTWFGSISTSTAGCGYRRPRKTPAVPASPPMPVRARLLSTMGKWQPLTSFAGKLPWKFSMEIWRFKQIIYIIYMCIIYIYYTLYIYIYQIYIYIIIYYIYIIYIIYLQWKWWRFSQPSWHLELLGVDLSCEAQRKKVKTRPWRVIESQIEAPDCTCLSSLTCKIHAHSII